jgi:putative redox protein
MESESKTGNSNGLSASLSLVNDKMHITARAGSNEPIHTDYIPPYGDNLGYMPLQLFLISLGSCASGAILVLLRKMQKTINGLEVKVSGVRRETHPTSFEEITLEFLLKSPDVKASDMDKVLELSEGSICPVWAMIKGNVTVKTRYSIN